MKTKRSQVLVVAALIVGLLVFAEALNPTGAGAALPVPSVPTFDLKFVDHSYEAAGATVDYGSGPHYVAAHYVRNGTILVTIENQPFTKYLDANNHTIELFYHVRCKGHYDSSWIFYPAVDVYIQTSNGDTTVFDYGINSDWVANPSAGIPNIPPDGKLDFQVETFIGYSQTILTSIAQRADDYHTFYTGQASGWSSTKTISISDGAVSTPTPESTSAPTEAATAPPQQTGTAIPTQHPTISPNQPTSGATVVFGPDLTMLVTLVLLGVIAVLLVFVVFYLRKVSLKQALSV
jgi:hypothetical protein